jgi:hypothetical protein
MPRFTTWFSTRTFYHQYPLTFSLSNIIAVVTTTAYGMYIYERFVHLHTLSISSLLTRAVRLGWPRPLASM